MNELQSVVDEMRRAGETEDNVMAGEVLAWADKLAAISARGEPVALGREDLYDTANDAFNDAYDGAPDGGGVTSALRHVVDCVVAELPAAATEVTVAEAPGWQAMYAQIAVRLVHAEALAAKWREDAGRIFNNAAELWSHQKTEIAALNKCADELTAALTGAPKLPTPHSYDDALAIAGNPNLRATNPQAPKP